jgi:hypothetical protein
MEASNSDQDLSSVSKAFTIHFAASVKRVESTDPKAFQDLESALLETPYAVLKERLMRASDLEGQLNSVPHARYALLA